MYKITVERIDPENVVTTTKVYLTAAQAKGYEAEKVKVEKRALGNYSWEQQDVKERPFVATLPIIDSTRQLQKTVYEQVVEGIDLKAIIDAVNP